MADLAEQLLMPDQAVSTVRREHLLNALPTFQSDLSSGFASNGSRSLRFGLLSTFPPTQCGVARFSSGLSAALTAQGSEVAVVRVADGLASSSAQVVGEFVNGSEPSAAACADWLNRSDVALIQHADGLYGGTHGDQLLDITSRLRVPSVVIAHSVLKNPAPHQRWVLEQIAATTDRIVVMSETARELLCSSYAVERRRVVTIPHGADIPQQPRGKRASRPLILTWGLLAPGKGIERVIEAMPSLRDVPGRPRYLVAGQTHPKVLAVEGEAYRDRLIEQVHRIGVDDSVTFDARYYAPASQTELTQSAAVIVLPYDSREQVSSGVLADAIACGRPVVATAFPHALDLLCGGAGIVVDQDDQAGLTKALRRVLTQPRLAGSMAAEARNLAPDMEWSAVGASYLRLAQLVAADHRARSTARPAHGQASGVLGR